MYQFLHKGDGSVTIADEGSLPIDMKTARKLLEACEIYLRRSDCDVENELIETMCRLWPSEARELGYLPHKNPGETKKQRKIIKGHIYLIFDESLCLHKIGITTKLSERVKAIKNQSGSKKTLVKSVFVEDIYLNESRIHSNFSRKRVQGEWFNLTDSEAEAVKSQMDQVAIGDVS
jgi:hypothetical protein